jgi:hypothetical protein
MRKLKAAETLLALERDYQERKRKIRDNPQLSLEKRNSRLRCLATSTIASAVS